MASRRGSSCSAPASVPGGAAGSHSLHSPGPASAGAAPPAPSACRLQVVRAVVLAPARDAGYCCLAYDAAPLVRVARVHTTRGHTALPFPWTFLRAGTSRSWANPAGKPRVSRAGESPAWARLRDGVLFFQARHLYICDFHKNLIQSVRNRRKRKGSDDDGDSPVQDVDTPEVDLYQLQVNTLRRYKRHFKLQTRPGLNKAQLVEIIGCHFRTIPVNEKDTLTYFIYSVKNDKNKPDLKMDSGVH
nr:PREDICTED: histone deacetylase complex subunit SAP30 [Opisthocomus hoazin]